MRLTHQLVGVALSVVACSASAVYAPPTAKCSDILWDAYQVELYQDTTNAETPGYACVLYAQMRGYDYIATDADGTVCVTRNVAGGWTDAARIYKICEPDQPFWNKTGSALEAFASLSLEDGGKIAGAILAVWAVGWAVRVLARQLKTTDGESSTSESES